MDRQNLGPEKAMITPPDDKFVSIVGEHYFQPIATLLNELISRPEPAANDVKTSYYENGFACAVCLLVVVCLESYSMRLRFFNRSAPAAEKRNCLEFLRDLYSCGRPSRQPQPQRTLSSQQH